ncbi:MAG TPA: ECF-type sigma factor [Thermoanaerobaculia bacterium]|nr:ECF-type sigma factor [Thermoanaerobaculia bacterium]
MSSDDPGSITRLLRAHRDGERDAFDRLVSVVYDELRRMARQQLRRAGSGHTLDTVALVHDAYARLVEQEGLELEDRSHFYAVVARAMRFVVVERARRWGAQKRGGGLARVTLDPELAGVAAPAEVVLAVDQAIDRLAAFNERLARIVELRFFSGLDDGEIATTLGVSTRTVQRDWIRARAWLLRALGEDGSPTS